MAGFLVAGSGCAGYAQRYGEVRVREGMARRSLQPNAVAERGAPGVAVISTDSGRGMGFVIDPDGYLLTNRHVVEDADHIRQVSFPARQRSYTSVRIVYIDPVRDLALLKIEAEERLTSVPLATRRIEKTGNYLSHKDRVVVLEQARARSRKAPEGHAGLVARTGLVASLNERNEIAGPGAFVGLTTDVERGQSGGPVLDRYGRAVGVVTWAWRHQRGGYAIPIAEATRMLSERPRVEQAQDLHARAQLRVEQFLEALARQRYEQARRMTSPTYAKEVRERSVVEILGGREGNEGAVLSGFASALEVMAQDRGVQGNEDAFELLQDVVWRTGSGEFRAALALDHSLPREQVFSFFYEFGQAYVAARYFGDRSFTESVHAGIERLHTVDAARTFALAELTTALGDLEPKVASIHINPGAYAPTAVAFLRTSHRTPETESDGAMSRAIVQRDLEPGLIRLSLRFEWGDWYIGKVSSTSLGARSVGD